MPTDYFLNADEIRLFFDAWTKEIPKNTQNCDLCASINISTQTNVPNIMKALTLRLNTVQGSILVCPRCGQFYQYTSWMSSPDWGESMEGITESYEVKALYKRDPENLLKWILRIARKGSDQVRLQEGGPKTEEILKLKAQIQKNPNEQDQSVKGKNENQIIVEKTKRSNKLKKASTNPEIVKAVGHCPNCGSLNVRCIGGGYEFTEMHCFDCGNDEYVDEYQLNEWYP